MDACLLLSSVLLVGSAALLVAAVVCVLLPSGVEARSNGQLIASGCDLSPQLGWPNGRFGRNKTGAGNAGITIGVDSGIMRSADAEHAHTTKQPACSEHEPQRSDGDSRHAPPLHAHFTDCMILSLFVLFVCCCCCCCCVVVSLVACADGRMRRCRPPSTRSAAATPPCAPLTRPSTLPACTARFTFACRTSRDGTHAEPRERHTAQ